MDICSTDYLKLLDRYDCALVLQRGAPVTRLKQDMLSLVTPDGHKLTQSCNGFEGLVQPPRAILDDFLAQHYVAQDGPQDEEGRIIFRLTPDGRKAAQ